MTTIDPQLVSSTEFIEVEVTYKIAGKSADPTAFVGYMAFKTSKDDEPGFDFTNPEWNSAPWIPGATKPTLECAIGPKYGGIVLAPGLWHVFWAVDDGSTQAPVRYAGQHRIR